MINSDLGNKYDNISTFSEITDLLLIQLEKIGDE